MYSQLSVHEALFRTEMIYIPFLITVEELIFELQAASVALPQLGRFPSSAHRKWRCGVLPL
jgi:hypothetical protein